MRQTTLSVPLEVKRDSCAQLEALIDALRTQNQPAGYPDQYKRLVTEVPAAHFMSLSVFPNAAYDPMFILEANFDGPPGVFWGQLEATFGPELREMLRCCKRPRDEDGPLYDAVTAPDSRAPIAPYFEARTQRPSVFHHGNRGLTRDRILAEAELFLATRRELASAPAANVAPYSTLSSRQIHQRLRTALLPTSPWLDQPPPVRISSWEGLADFSRLALFAVVVLICLTAPGIVLSLIVPMARYLLLIGVLTALVAFFVFRVRKPRPGEAATAKANIVVPVLRQAPLLILLLVAYVIAASAILFAVYVVAASVSLTAPIELHWRSWRDIALATVRLVLLGLASLPLTLAVLVYWLRYLERRDSSQDDPITDPATLRGMTRREDWIAQNHMASIVIIKPGVLRTIIVKAGHLGLGLVLRVIAKDGYLGSMRTVHFAHWAFVNNSSRLLFLSNFDHSWGSYLDDFIEKAAVGLTLAWGAGIGFPATRFLVLDGASHGPQFKAWALASRAVTRFWYSAYRDLTVDQIERQTRIATGLRKPVLGAKEADQWLLDL